MADGFVGHACQMRRVILRETLDAFGDYHFPTRFHHLASANLARWRITAPPRVAAPQTLVVRGDWGDVAGNLTKQHGECFAVLNMANAFYPGGAYGEGASAQEENMFRRTDCHFRVKDEHLQQDGRTYVDEMSRLLHGLDGEVYLDVAEPRVCVRGPECRDRSDLGYDWLAETDIFPFFELRAAAQDLRGGGRFDSSLALRTITSILETLSKQNIRHVVLGAIGCGAFENPPADVAALFRAALLPRVQDFEVVAFAILDSVPERDNFTPFARALNFRG